jgi:hypothetical protein
MDPHNNNVVVFCWQSPGSSENRACKIARLVGAEAIVTSVAQATSAEALGRLVPACAAVVVHADTLVRLCSAVQGGSRVLTDLSPRVFVYGFACEAPHARMIRSLSGGGLEGVEVSPRGDAEFHVCGDSRELCAQFSGLLFRTPSSNANAVFVAGALEEGQSVLVRLAGRPFFVRTRHSRGDIFLLASRELADMDEPVGGDEPLLPWFSGLVPLMIFLRHALGRRAWHNPQPRACLILDDPLLKPRHGFLDFAKLREAMAREKFAASIAFIPWNHRRSSEQVARLFAGAPHSLSLCVHGCDHTGAEFAAADRDLLLYKARLALARMRSHTEQSGVPFDDVMVFPQGLFSSEALQALDACGYLAAINTDADPVGKSPALTLRERSDVAIAKFEGVPLFVRHYPREIAEFAFDLFLGKPALVVEHHGYFRNGYQEPSMFMGRLGGLDKTLEWGNLAAICSRACLRRVTPQGEVEVRFYTNRFCLTHSGAEPQSHVLLCRRSFGSSLPAVTVNGSRAAVESRHGNLAISVSLRPGQTAEVSIAAGPVTGGVWKPAMSYGTGVWMRRLLCEIRDDYVDTSRFLTGIKTGTQRLRAWRRAASDETATPEEFKGRPIRESSR